MTSLSRRGAGDGPSLPGKDRHFFKIILDTINPDGKLGIPGKFVRKYGEFLSNPVFLKVPNGRLWKVELMKCDDDAVVWLQKGWPEFAKFYSIGYGDFLVFRYEGNSNFHVLIFDKSATEIKYPSDATHNEEPNLDQLVEEEKIELDDSVEILDDLSKKRGQTPLQSLRPCKMTRANPTSKVGNTSRQQSPALHTQSKGIKKWKMKCAKSKREVGSHSSIKEVKAEVDIGVVSPRREKSKALERKQLVAALGRAKAYKPKNPFFMVPMGRSYVTGCLLSVPTNFALQYFSEACTVILRVSDGRTWSAKGRSKSYDKGMICQIYSGWRSFVKANNLKVGDVCVFELVEGSKITLEVVIFRVIEGANYEGIQSRRLMKCSKSKRDKGFQSSPQEFGEGRAVIPIRGPQYEALGRIQSVTAKERARALQRAKAFKSSNPFFIVTMRSSYIERSLHMPLSFSSRYFSEKPKNVILRVSDGRTWPAKGFLKPYDFGMRSLLNFGWSAFARDNNLKVGNVCAFELVKSTEITLQVVIF